MFCFCLLFLAMCRISFFFSGRSRHTGWPRDWSSDVCSSDLSQEPLPVVAGPAVELDPDAPGGEVLVQVPARADEEGCRRVRPQARELQPEQHAAEHEP